MTGQPPEATSDAAAVARLSEYDDALASHAGPPVPPDDDLAFLHLLDRLRPPQPPPDDEPTERYVLRGLRAEGGIGQVWLAHDGDLDREVALKVLRPDRACDPALAARFLHEARVTGRLQHPGIVPVYDFDPRPDSPPFYTMRLVPGRTLAEAIRELHASGRSRVAEVALLNALVGVANAVAYAHSRGVIHRDLKPENVALGEFGEVIVLDWGFAKVRGKLDPPPGAAAPADPRQTAAGQILGTPAYMAPEQLDGRADVRTDVYGLGAILYELITNRPPYPCGDSATVLAELRAGPPPRLSSIAKAVPKALEAICHKAMARDPATRYPDAAGVSRDIQHFLADEPVEAYHEGTGARLRRWGRHHPALVAASAALVMTATLAAGLVSELVRREQARSAEERVAAARQHSNTIGRAQNDLRLRLYLHHVALAERTLAANNPSRTTALLQACPENLRDWEWHCLNRLCREVQRPWQGHTGSVQAAAFSPDGGTLATGGFDGTVRLWDVTTGSTRRVLGEHRGVVYDLAYSPDGRTLATASWDETVRVWNAATGQCLRTIEGHGGRVEGVVYSADGQTLYTRTGGRREVYAWSARDGRRLRSATLSEVTLSLAITPDGRCLAAGLVDGSVQLIDGDTLEETRVLRGHGNPVRALAFSHDGRLLASGDGDMGRADVGEVIVWDWMVSKELRRFVGHTEPIMKLSWGSASRLASASLDQTVKLWDLVTGQEALTLHGHSDIVRTVAFSPNGLRLASAGGDRQVCVWNATPWETTTPPGQRRSFAAHAGRALGVAFRPDGRQLTSVGADYSASVFDLVEPSEPQRIDFAEVFKGAVTGERSDYFAIAYAPDGRLATANSAGNVVIFDPTNGRPEVVFAGHAAGPVRGLAFRPGGRQIASASWDRTARIWSLDTGQVERVLAGHSEPVNGLAFSPDGHWLATASNDKTVRVWDADTGRETREPLAHPSGVFGVAVSPNGTLIASAGNDGTVRLWDAATGRERTVLRGHSSAVRAVAFSPDGLRLASAGHDWTVRLWSVAGGDEVAALRGHGDRVHGLAFAPDGRTLASAGYDGTVKLWDVPPAQE